MGKVVLVRPNGTKTEVDREQAEKLKVLGYREETQEELVDRAAQAENERIYNQPLEKLETAAEGWAGAATLGVSDALNPDKEGARQRAKYNKGYRLAGEMGAGLLGAVVIPGSAAKTIGGRVAAEAGVGAVMGAGNALTESSLTGDPLTVTSVLAHGGVGALFGTGASIAGESLIGIGNKIRRGRLAEAESLGSFSPATDTLASFHKSLPAEKAVKKGKDVPEWVAAAENTADDDLIREFTTTRESYTPKPFNDGSYTNFRRSLDDVVTTTKQVNTDLTASIKEHQIKLKEYRRQLESTAADLDAAVKVTKRNAKEIGMDSADELAFRGLEDQYKTIKKALTENDPVKALSALERYQKRIKENPFFSGPAGASLPPTPDAGGKMATRLRDMSIQNQKAIKAAEEAVKLKAVAKELSAFPRTQEEFVKLTGPKLERLAGALDNAPAEFDLSSIDRLVDDLGISSSGSYGDKLRTIHQAVKEAKVFVPTSKEVKGARFEFPGKPPKEIATLVEEKPPSFEDLIRNTDKPPPRNDMFDEGVMDFPGFSTGAPGNVVSGKRSGGYKTHTGFFGNIVKAVSARKASAAARTAGLGVAGSGAAYVGTGALMDAVLTGGLIGGVVGAKAAVVGRIANGVAKYGPGVGAGIKKTGGRIDPLLTRLTGDYEEKGNRGEKQLVKDRIQELTSAGPGYNDAVFMAVQDIVGEYPEFAKGLMDAAIVAFNGLMEFVPRDPGLSFNRLNSLWNPSPIQIAQFRKALTVFHDPMGSIDDILLNGKPDAFTVKALKTMYPPLYQELQSRMLNRVTNPEFLNSLSYEEQAKLSVMLEIPLHSSFTPRSIAQTQSIYQRALENRPPPPGNSSGSGGRPQKMEPPTAGQSLISR